MRDRALLVIHLDRGVSAEKIHKFVEELLKEGASITILASSDTAGLYANLSVTVWPDGAPRGALRLLGLVRRISWANFAAIYDFEASRRTRAYRWCVRPCPAWHSAAELNTCKHNAS